VSDPRFPDVAERPDRDPECDALGEVLCAYADGEATPLEATRVRQHITRCLPCGEALREYGVIDESLRLSVEWAGGVLASRPTTSGTAGSVGEFLWARWARRIAALLLAGIGVGLLVVLPGSNANAARVVRSAATVEVLQDQERTAQEKLRRTLEWELRALRLEVGLLVPKSVEPATDPAEALRDQIDQLLARCVALKASE